MAKKQFKTESKKLLDMMINSIYTNREIFIRELISNASDALDKRYYHDLESGTSGVTREDYTIRITPDKDARTLTISDNGIGMTKEELESNLGTIAKSGSLDFKNAHQTGDESGAEDAVSEEGSRESKEKNVTDIIGQFGVGFYSAFMVADKVTVTSRVQNASNAYAWESSGTDGYTVEEAEKADAGTDVVLHLKADTDAENYSQYLEEYEIRSLIRKYSDYIHYPITMMVTKSRPVEKAEEEQAQDQKDEDQNKPPEMETYQELDTLNSMEPIWKKAKSQVTDEEYNEYYKGKFSDYEDPCRVIRTSVEGVSSYTALLFIPNHTPFNYYTKDYEKGLQLYSSGVLIMDKCKDLLPDYFNFVRGLVDSQDLSLNISRETLQQDRQLKNIAKNLQKKIKADLADFMKNDRDGYEKFFKNFGRSLKYGIYEGYGMTKDLLADLLLFYSSTEKKMISLDEYIAKMGEDQKYIYYAPGETVEKVDMLPQVEAAKAKGYEVLYLTDEMDEFVVKMMHDYKEKEFLSVSEADMSEEETEEEKKALEELKEKNKDLLAFIQSTLGDAVSEVRLSRRLGDASVTLTSKGGISIEMEKTLNQMPMNQGVKAEKILELNPDHAVMKKMQDAFGDGTDESGKELTAVYARLLYDQAAMISGLSIQDPARMAQDIDTLITK
ncbi:molecular chaperone HtpG [Eubacterium pyruvativorans]|uniref:Chaperone protein HtpG n=1 Tax=Eubacterium pyruvativorans TaxID=155865 RepID=A0A1I7EY83_9FIRM|nr:molecular chaperone HtpG [Eubacterium pyruvativorans]SFN91626.1 molecular chaperone HtpG [Eubacterium pyruvativorans]SFU28893.1 molecular chaperone HtpG [Eubacterium pyruvativorans]